MKLAPTNQSFHGAEHVEIDWEEMMCGLLKTYQHIPMLMKPWGACLVAFQKNGMLEFRGQTA